MNPPVILLGGGGHAAVVAATLRTLGRTIAGFIAPSAPVQLSGFPYLGSDEALGSITPAEVEIAVAVGSVVASGTRQRLFEAAARRGFRFATIVHPHAIVDQSATLGEGAQVLAGAIVQAEACIGDNAIVNSGAIVEHGSSIGAHAHVASGAVVAGNVRLGTGSHVGAGAVILQGCIIGEGVTIGAAACVTCNVDSGMTVIGVPARAQTPREQQQ